jgi:HK97 family phage prohead protease
MAYDEPRTVGGDTGWTEIWNPGAAVRSVDKEPDVRLTLNGEGQPIARSKAGSLELISDDYGLKIRATIDTGTSRGEDIALALQRNEQVDVLVGFDVLKQRWNSDHRHRVVEEVALHDMAVVMDGWDPRNDDDGLAGLHVASDPDTDGEGGISLELARAINDEFDTLI